MPVATHPCRLALVTGASALLLSAIVPVAGPTVAASAATGGSWPAAAVAAAPQWEPIQRVDPRLGLQRIRSETSTAGSSTITWENLAIEKDCTSFYRSVRRPDDTQWTAYERVGRTYGGTPRPLVAGDDDATVLTWTTCDREKVKLQRLRPDGWGRLRVVKAPTATTALPAAPNDVRGLAVVWASNAESPTEIGGSYRPKGGPWQALAPLTLEDADLEYVALTNAGEVIAVTSTPQAYLVSTYADGTWTTETLPIADGRVAELNLIASTPAGHLAIGLLVKDRPSHRDADFEVHVRRPGETFQPPEVLKKDRPCEDYWDECAALDMDADGNLIALWPTSTRLDGVYDLSRRDVATGVWTTVQDVIKPGFDLEPFVDMHADGTAVAWVDDGYGYETSLYVCPADAECVEVAYPADPTPGVFVAGPAGTATAAFADEVHCDDWCETEQVKASRWLP